MPAPRILFVKLSSLGDVIHLFPAVTDLAARMPEAHIGWAAEEAYVELVRLHPVVAETFAVNLRALRRNLLRPSSWLRMTAASRALARGRWDYVIDAQGLAKSAMVAGFARGPRFGLDAKSARERIAARSYDVKLAVPRDLHAVERNRRLVGEVFGYRPEGAPQYGLARPDAPPAWAPPSPYVVMLHAASRAAKRWPEERWTALGHMFASRGYAAVFPGGTDAERASAARLAATVPDAMAAPAMSLVEAAALLGHARYVAGVDTGLTHLAVALGTPTAGIYCATDPRLTGLHGAANAFNVGGMRAPPTPEAVAAALGLDAAVE